MSIASGLYWSAGILVVLAAVLMFGALGWTTTPEALVRAASIAAALGLPAIVLFLLAYWHGELTKSKTFGATTSSGELAWALIWRRPAPPSAERVESVARRTTDAPDLGRASDLVTAFAIPLQKLVPLGLVAGTHPATRDWIEEAERIQEQERRSRPGDEHGSLPMDSDDATPAPA